MIKYAGVVVLRWPSAVDGPLVEIRREGECRMLTSALEAKVKAVLERYAAARSSDGRRRVDQRTPRRAFRSATSSQAGQGGRILTKVVR